MIAVPPAIAELTTPAFRAMAFDLNASTRAELNKRLRPQADMPEHDLFFLVNEITIQSACVALSAAGGLMQQSYHRSMGYAEAGESEFMGSESLVGYGLIRHTGFDKSLFDARMTQLRYRRDLVARQFMDFGFLVTLQDGYIEPAAGVHLGEYADATLSWALPG